MTINQNLPFYFGQKDFSAWLISAAKLKKGLKLEGDLFSGTNLNSFDLGKKIGTLTANKPEVLVNRTLQSLMNPQAVARDVFGVVDIQSINPGIRVEARYAGTWNFMARPVNGYKNSRCYLTTKAAKALSEVANDVKKMGYDLLVFDCYRPQRAVNDFVSWVKDGTDSATKEFFYPDEKRSELIKRGYIDDHSGHSRASTVDLTLIESKSGLISSKESYTDCRKPQNIKGQLDMGTSFDCFSELAYTESTAVSDIAQKNRRILRDAMAKRGFKNYPKEWWHYTLNEEPYKNIYFDFEVQ